MHTAYRRGEEKSGAPWNTWGEARRGAPFMPRKALDFPQARRDKGVFLTPLIFSPAASEVVIVSRRRLYRPFPARIAGKHGRNDVGRTIERRRLELGNHRG